MGEFELGLHAAPVPLVARARGDRDRDRGRRRLGRAAADLVLQARPARPRVRARDGQPAADRLPRLRVHDPAGGAPPALRARRGVDARRRAAHGGDLLRDRGRLGLPVVRAEPGLHRPPLPPRERLVVRGPVALALPARLLPEHPPVDRPRGAGRAVRGRRGAAAPPPVDARRAVRPRRAHRARRAAVSPLVPPHAPRRRRRSRRDPHLPAAGAGRRCGPAACRPSSRSRPTSRNRRWSRKRGRARRGGASLSRDGRRGPPRADVGLAGALPGADGPPRARRAGDRAGGVRRVGDRRGAAGVAAERRGAHEIRRRCWPTSSCSGARTRRPACRSGPCGSTEGRTRRRRRWRTPGSCSTRCRRPWAPRSPTSSSHRARGDPATARPSARSTTSRTATARTGR